MTTRNGRRRLAGIFSMALLVHVPGGATAANLGGMTLSGNAASDELGIPGDDDDFFGTTALPVTVSEFEIE